MKQLLEAGVHFGHQTRRWEPKMAEYIFQARNGIHIIDLQKTSKKLDEAYKFLKEQAEEGKTVLFVGTKKQAQECIKEAAIKCNMYYVDQRWLGGMLTNFNTIQSRVKRLKELETMAEDGTFDVLPKKEVILLKGEMEKLEKNLGGIKDMKEIPGVIFVVDPKKERIAILEARKLNIPVEHASLLIPSLLIYKKALDYTQTEVLWAPGVRLCDGIAASYAQKHCNVNFSHDFVKDILNTSYNLAKRYKGNIGHTELLEIGSTAIYDAMKKYHGLGKRERLLLQIATILHDCGKYISITQPGECSYNIIMATEIIGLSHNEREIVANVVRYNTREFDYKSGTDKTMSNTMYLTVAKLTAILRIANAMDRSHRQKLKKMKIFLKQEELVIQVETLEDISLELALFSQKADFFEEVYGVRPVLKRIFR